MNPEIDLEAINDGTNDDHASQTQFSSFVFASEEKDDPRSQSHSSITAARDPTPEPLPSGSSGFDWGKEGYNVSEQVDGMGIIAVDTEGVGYLGKLTNVALFRMLHKSGQLSRHVPVSASHPQLARDCSNEIPWEELEKPSFPGGLSDLLMDGYFHHFHTTYPILHEATFRAQYAEVLPKPPEEAWSLLIRTVFAIGAWCTGCRISTGRGSGTSDCLDLFQNIDLLRSGPIHMVQALTLLGCYLHKQNKPNTASIYLAAAAKMGMSLGLHREFPDWNISLLDREMRRRVWWCLCVLDSGQSIAMGRPIPLPHAGAMDVKPPLNIPEQALSTRTNVLSEEFPGLTIYSNLLAQVQFHLMINNPYNRYVNNPEVPIKELLTFDSKVTTWAQALPPHLQEAIPPQTAFSWLKFAPYHLFWRIRCLKIVLFFPILLKLARRHTETTVELPDADHQQAIRVCIDHAHASITSIHNFFTMEPSNPLRDRYAQYCLIQGALVSILALQTNLDSLKDYRATLLSDIEVIKVLLEGLYKPAVTCDDNAGHYQPGLDGALTEQPGGDWYNIR